VYVTTKLVLLINSVSILYPINSKKIHIFLFKSIISIGTGVYALAGLQLVSLRVESCTGTSFCTRTRPEYLRPDPTDTFKNMINFSNFYFTKNIKNIQRNSTFSSTSMGDESLNHHQIHFDSIFSILIIVKN